MKNENDECDGLRGGGGWQIQNDVPLASRGRPTFDKRMSFSLSRASLLYACKSTQYRFQFSLCRCYPLLVFCLFVLTLLLLFRSVCLPLSEGSHSSALVEHTRRAQATLCVELERHKQQRYRSLAHTHSRIFTIYHPFSSSTGIYYSGTYTE